MSLSRSAILSALLLITASYSTTSLADHPPYAAALLTETKSPVNRQIITLIEKKDYKKLQELLAKGTDINIADDKGSRPVHIAAYMGSLEAIKLFAAHGADLRATTFGKWTPLHYAALTGHTEVADFLVRAGTPINAKDSGGESPLFYAIETGNMAAVQWFANHGANINHENNHGETPLSTALENGHKHIAEYLQKLGAKHDPADEAEAKIRKPN